MLIVVVIVSTIISGFTPITEWNSEYFYEDQYDIYDDDVIITAKNSYFLQHRAIKDFRTGFPSEYHSYQFFHIFLYETGNSELDNEFYSPSDYDEGNTGFFTQSIFNMLGLILVSMTLIVFIYLVFFLLKI